MSRFDELVQAAFALTESQLDLLLEMAEALTSPVEQTLDPTTDLVDSPFADRFCDRLRIHHATTAEKFKKKTFEYAFVEASRHGGHEAEITSSATMAGADVVRNGERFSLKTYVFDAADPRDPARHQRRRRLQVHTSENWHYQRT